MERLRFYMDLGGGEVVILFFPFLSRPPEGHRMTVEGIFRTHEEMFVFYYWPEGWPDAVLPRNLFTRVAAYVRERVRR